MDINSIMPLGKYEGQPIHVLANDPSYKDWLISQAWFREKYNNHYTIIINNFGAPSKTPEHNEMQTRFLSDDYCYAVAYLCKWRLMSKKKCLMNLGQAVRKIKEQINNYQSNFSIYQDKLEAIKDMQEIVETSIIEENGIAYLDGEPYYRIDRKTEENYWDIIIKTNDSFCKNECDIWNECSIKKNQIGLELKPSVGDDYPTILMKIKQQKFQPFYRCLIYKNFSASGATLEEFKKTFNNEDIFVFSMSEVYEALGKYSIAEATYNG